jgi:hypothetical protein
MPIGFKTAFGSTYAIQQNGQTVRTKRSMGQGRGQTHAAYNCLYVPQQVFDAITNDEDLSFQLGYANGDATGFTSFKAGEVLSIPAGKIPAVLIFNDKTAQGLYLSQAATVPTLGLHPFENWYEGVTPYTHPGNKIVDIYE